MTIVHCEKCGGFTPEGFSLCPACMSEAGANKKDVQAISGLLEIVNVLNIGGGSASQKRAVESILSIHSKFGKGQ